LNHFNLPFSELGYVSQHELSSQKTWMYPQSTNSGITEGISVQVTVFYLGQSSTDAGTKYYWRYVIRLQNKSEQNVTLRERTIKVFSLNNLTQMNSGLGVVGQFPQLTRSHPAFQFSSMVDLAQKRHNHMW
jgi:uncharacterized protein affecting Mg2+/Co2+ transport